MALNAANLGSELEQAVRSSQGLDGTPYPQLTAYCNAIAQAIVDHFKNNATVNVQSFSGDTDARLTSPNNHEHTLENFNLVAGIE